VYEGVLPTTTSRRPADRHFNDLINPSVILLTRHRRFV